MLSRRVADRSFASNLRPGSRPRRLSRRSARFADPYGTIDVCSPTDGRGRVGFPHVPLMPTATSLTLRALLSQASARAALDRLAPITAGLTPTAKALAAVVAARGAAGVTLLIVPTDK